MTDYKGSYAARDIVDAVQRNEPHLIMPRFLYTTFVARIPPVGIVDWPVSFFGVSKSMGEFAGRRAR